MGVYVRCLVGALGGQEDKKTGRQGGRGITLTVVVPVGVDGVPDGVAVLVVRPPFADPMGHLARLWFEQWGFPRACRHLQADLAHIPHYGAPLHLPCPMVVTVHDLILWQMPAYSHPPLLRAYSHLIRATASRATHIITDANFTRHQLIKDWGIHDHKITTIPLAPAPIFTHHAPRTTYHAPYLLYVGGFDVRKNVAMLLQAYAKLPASFRQQFPLVLAGKIPKTQGVYQDPRPLIQQLNLTNCVQLPGWIPTEALPSLYANATLFLYPSRYEGFGLPVLEAMACGVPVVTSNVAAMVEVVGNAGILLDPNNPQAWRDTIIHLCQNQTERIQWSERGLHRVAEFDWQKTATATADVYLSTIHL